MHPGCCLLHYGSVTGSLTHCRKKSAGNYFLKDFFITNTSISAVRTIDRQDGVRVGYLLILLDCDRFNLEELTNFHSVESTMSGISMTFAKSKYGNM